MLSEDQELNILLVVHEAVRIVAPPMPTTRSVAFLICTPTVPAAVLVHRKDRTWGQ